MRPDATITARPARPPAGPAAAVGPAPRWLRLSALSAATATACVVVAGAVVWLRTAHVSSSVFVSMTQSLETHVWEPWFFGFVGVLWVLQWRYPARSGERQFGKALVQDAAWFLLTPVLAVSVISAYMALLGAGLPAVFGHHTADLVPHLGVWRVAVLAFVLSDLLNWIAHLAHHKLPALWQFHAVHHSQREMSALSDNRTHVVETMVTSTLVFVPAWFLGLGTGQAATLALVTIYISAFIHTNIRTNLGIARFVFVSPQAHRVHHSIDPEHFNTNYGTVFSWWDYLFGTRHPHDGIYPSTGITDPAFPMGSSAGPVDAARTWWQQLCYPFAVLAGSAAYR